MTLLHILNPLAYEPKIIILEAGQFKSISMVNSTHLGLGELRTVYNNISQAYIIIQDFEH